jgi:arginine/lysine/ornithine decarboxylase
MENLSQEDVPIAAALKKYKQSRVVRFDVPGHKGGRENPELIDFFGKECMAIDVNSMKMLDNLCHPTSVILEAENLAAEAFHAKHAFFMVGGTSSSVQAMIMSTCKAGEKIILPRNVHKSAINALVISGAIPVYINPGINRELGVPLGMSLESVREAVRQNPDAKAIFINNPTYYGICSNAAEIARIAHENGMLALADEAHGTHFYFNDKTPQSAMDAGFDMAAVSIHKTGGSLTQSSILFCNKNVPHVAQIINLTQTTSASYLLLASLDIARRNLSLNGQNMIDKTLGLAAYARHEIEEIGGYKVFDKRLANGDDVYDFDLTKLSVNTLGIGLAGIEVYDYLRDEYNIQIEFGDIGNFLAIISHADRTFEIERLIGALSEIKRIHAKPDKNMFNHEYINPKLAMTPQAAFYAEKSGISLKKCNGKICGESVMCYPPGIPILAPGEIITSEIIDYINYAKEKGCQLTGTEDINVENLMVIK